MIKKLFSLILTLVLTFFMGEEASVETNASKLYPFHRVESPYVRKYDIVAN